AGGGDAYRGGAAGHWRAGGGRAAFGNPPATVAWMANQLWPTTIISNGCAGTRSRAGQNRSSAASHSGGDHGGSPARTANSAPTAKGCTAATTSAGVADRPPPALARLPPPGLA